MGFRIAYEDRAEAQIDTIAEGLIARYGPDTVGRFLESLNLSLEKEALFVEIGRRAPAPEGPPRGRLLYPMIVRGGGTWRLLYVLEDRDEDGQADTLAVFSVTHAYSLGEGS